LNNIKLYFLILLGLISTILLSYQLDYKLKDDCNFLEKSGFIMNPLYLENPNKELLTQYTFIDPSSLISKFTYEENDLLFIREIVNNKDTIKIYNIGLDELYTFNFDKKIEFNFKENNVISFNPKSIKDSENKLTLQLYSGSENKIQFSRIDVRTGKIIIEDKPYFIAVTTNSFCYNKNDFYCSYFIDKNNNMIYDFDKSFDESGYSINEKYNIDDSFVLNGTSYQISSISSDGFQIEIEKINDISKVAQGFTMPNFDYYSNGKNKIFNNINDEVTFIFWWKPNCPGSVSGVPAINKIWNDFNKTDGFNFISLTALDSDSFNRLSSEMVLPSKETVSVNFPTNTNNDSLNSLFGEKVPRVIIVDRNGVIKLDTACSFNAGNYDESKDENLKTYNYYVNELLKDEIE